MTFEQVPQTVEQIFETVKILQNSINQKPQEDEILTIEKVALILNCDISTIKRNKDIPKSRRLKQFYILKSDLLKWIKDGKIEQQEEKKIFSY